MIHFDFNWLEPLNVIILTFAIALLPMQLWLILHGGEKGRFSQRVWIKLGLNVLLWLAVMAFIGRPYILKQAKTVTGMLVGKDVPGSKANALKDSVGSLKKAVSYDLKDAEFDTLILAGQDFDEEIFEKVMRAKVLPNAIQWIPYFAADRLEGLNWRGIVKKGEMQNITGSLESSEDQLLKVKYGVQTLDSIVLHPGRNRFALQFPVSTEGRTQVELLLADQTLDTIRFFARPAEKLTFQFILDSPDFESRALANWLGKAGHSVIYSATLSKDVKSRQTINKAGDADIVITDARNAGDALIKRVIKAGKSVLFINITNPAAEVKLINSALATGLRMERISAEEFVPVRPGLTALPFRFVNSNRYLSVKALPVVVEKKKGRVGVSLLNETFPLQLAGDSVAYQMVWDALLAPVLPVTGTNVDVEAPLFKGINAEIALNGFTILPKFLKFNADTLVTQSASLNPKAATVHFKPTKSGWIRSDDSLELEMYVENESAKSDIYKAARLTNFVKSYNSLQERGRRATLISGRKSMGIKREAPDWMWFSLLIFCFLALWIERKL